MRPAKTFRKNRKNDLHGKKLSAIVRAPSMKSSCAIFVLAILASISSLPQHSLAKGGIDPGVTAMVAFENADAVRVRSNANRFAVVTVSPGQTISVTLQFPIGFAGTPIAFEELDGSSGLQNGYSVTINDHVIASFRFLTPSESGLYRVFITAGATTLALPFSVAAQ